MTDVAATPTTRVADAPARHAMRHGVVAMAENADLTSVFHAMAEHGVHAVLIEDRASGRPLGWVTAQALLTWMNLEPGEAHAHEAMTPRVVTVPPDAPVREVVAALSRAGTTHVLVCEDGARAGEGVITALDVVAFKAHRTDRNPM
jgi:CBS domain-containing protein